MEILAGNTYGRAGGACVPHRYLRLDKAFDPIEAHQQGYFVFVFEPRRMPSIRERIVTGF